MRRRAEAGGGARFHAWSLVLLLSLAGAVATPVAGGDLFRFFAEEAEVVSAGRLPRALLQVPATVHVVPGRAVTTGGTQRLWESLRRVPGVEVMTPRAFQGEVSIRGLDRPLSNRTLVLLDGRTLLNSFFDFVLWEAIPVVPAEIDRIEVVEGPTSALYGANAVNGVINIITKTPAQLDGGQVGGSVGEGRSRSGYLLYGRRGLRGGYKVGANWRRAGQFVDPGRQATRVAEVHGQVEWNPRAEDQLRLAGGVGRSRTEITSGATGTTNPAFTTGFVRLDGTLGQTQLGGFWNWGRGEFNQFGLLNDPEVKYSTGEASAERRFRLPAANLLVAGASFRRLWMRSGTFGGRHVDHSLYSLYFEDEWPLRAELSLVFSGRLDRHELAGTALSPRLSAVYTPWPGQVFRAAVGTAFRNPNLNENFLALRQTLPAPFFLPPEAGFSGMEAVIEGNRSLRQERMLLFEVAHRGSFGRLATTVTGFRYRLEDVVVLQANLTRTEPPVLEVLSRFANQGSAAAWGGEAGAEWRWQPALTLAANYSYLRMSGPGDPLAARGSPAHKANAGAEFQRGGLAVDLWIHYVGPTWWAQNLSGFPIPDGKVDAYLLTHAGLKYSLAGPREGLELGLGAFNLLDRHHYQILPSTGPQAPGQYGERLGRRLNLSLRQHF